MNGDRATFGLGSPTLCRDPVRWLDLGPTHPVNTGLVRIDVSARAGVIEAVDLHPGTLHRGAEALFEVRDHRQALSLANRHDWQAPFFGELLLATIVEEQLGVEIPARAVWLRTLLGEQFRILAQVGFLTFLDYGFGSSPAHSEEVREAIRRQNSLMCGNRVHPMVIRLGGLAADADPDWLTAELKLLGEIRRLADALSISLTSDQFVTAATGIAVVTKSTIDEFGLSGITAGASGVHRDLRHRRPYLAYPQLPPPPDTLQGARGDAWERFRLLVEDLRYSADLIETCVQSLPDGPVGVRLPKVVKLPEGDAYAALEAPLGVAGLFVVSRGDKVPWRVKLRTPSFNQVSAWPAILPGCPVESLPLAIASLPYVPGDLEK